MGFTSASRDFMVLGFCIGAPSLALLEQQRAGDRVTSRGRAGAPPAATRPEMPALS